MRSAGRKIYRIRKIITVPKIVTAGSKKDHLVIKTDYFTACYSTKGKLIPTILYGPINNNSTESIVINDGHVKAELCDQVNRLSFKLSKTANTRLSLESNAIIFQTTLPARFGDVTNDLRIGENPGLGSCYCYKKVLWAGFHLQDQQTIFTFFQLPARFLAGSYLTYKFGSQRVISNAVVATSYKSDTLNASAGVIYNAQQFSYHFDLQLRQPKYTFLFNYMQAFGPSIGAAIKPLQLLGYSDPKIETTAVLQKDKVKALISTKITDNINVNMLTIQPFIGLPSYSFELVLNYETGNNNKK